MRADRMIRYAVLAAALIVVGVLLYQKQSILAVLLTMLILLFEQFPRLKTLSVSKGKLSVSLSDKLGPDLSQTLEEKVSQAINGYEKKTHRIVTEAARDAINAAITEGFSRRLDEYQERTGIAVDDLQGRVAAVEQAAAATTKLLESGDKKKDQVTVAELNRSVSANFCQVWPFC